ncbi:hypothetical protein Smic_39050 [Streptomyces microflavus]|uniref:Uncharacterized protein n=1 Tax=Streptomyces microflavus TaxID=1919 RepID=A0A7J0CST2_STRMI|nr:hypothetical protein Smic_39050 [Streptomyces microflavus]
MTAPRPEDDTGLQGPYEQGAYGADGAFVAAVEGLADPLNDPLPEQHTSPWFRSDTAQDDTGTGVSQDAAPVDGARPQAYGGPEQPQGPRTSGTTPRGTNGTGTAPSRPLRLFPRLFPRPLRTPGPVA